MATADGRPSFDTQESFLGGSEVKGMKTKHQWTEEEVLETAAQIIESGPGWCKGEMVNNNGHCCAVGAMSLTDAPIALQREARERFKSWLSANKQMNWGVISWNDAQVDKRTVIRNMRRCARAKKLS